MRLVIVVDIPEEDYIYIAKKHCLPSCDDRTLRKIFYKMIANGTPLDEVKAEIAEEICPTDNPYTGETKYTIEHLRLLEILDNIGKTESEG